jgi:hypothetical protein
MLIQIKKDAHWTRRNFLSYRALRLAANIRDQLIALLKTLDITNVDESCWPNREPFLRCLVHGLYLNVAQRVQGDQATQNNKSNVKVGKVFSADSNSTENNQNSVEYNKQQIFKIGSRTNSQQYTAPYQTLRGRQPVHIHPSSVLFGLSSKRLPACVVYSELLTTSKDYMRNVSVIEASWLTEIMPQVFKAQQTTCTTSNSNSSSDSR